MAIPSQKEYAQYYISQNTKCDKMIGPLKSGHMYYRLKLEEVTYTSAPVHVGYTFSNSGHFTEMIITV